MNTFYSSNPQDSKTILAAYKNLVATIETTPSAIPEIQKRHFIYLFQKGSELSTSANKDIFKNPDHALSLLQEEWTYFPVPSIIPMAILEPIAQALNWSFDKVVQLNTSQAYLEDDELQYMDGMIHPEIRNFGPSFIEKSLKEKTPNESLLHNLVIQHIPVSPSTQRPFLPCIGGKYMPGNDNLFLYMMFYNSESILERSKDLHYISRNGYRKVQYAFDQLTIALENNIIDNRWALEKIRRKQLNLKTEEAFVNSNTDQNPQTAFYREQVWENTAIPIDILWKNEQEIWIQFPNKLISLNINENSITQDFELPDLKMLSYSAQQEKLFFFGWQNWDEYTPNDFCSLNINNGEWENTSVNPFHYFLNEHSILNYKDKISLELIELAGEIRKFIISTCQRYFWVNDKYDLGGIYDFETGLAVAAVHHFDPDTTHELSHLKIEAWENDETYTIEKLSELQYEQKVELGALSLSSDNKWIFFDGKILFYDFKPILYIPPIITCAALNEDGSQLIIANILGCVILKIEDIIKGKLNYQYINNPEN